MELYGIAVSHQRRKTKIFRSRPPSSVTDRQCACERPPTVAHLPCPKSPRSWAPRRDRTDWQSADRSVHRGSIHSIAPAAVGVLDVVERSWEQVSNSGQMSDRGGQGPNHLDADERTGRQLRDPSRSCDAVVQY